ncbi:MAG: hypothetical protein M0Z75_10540 [Nitrospiraceae bacterium]|nr:hypothetical protein [Nitrospiraceae bacterium]
MEQAELQDKIYEFVQAAKGRRRLKGKDIIKGVSVSTGEIPEHVKESMRAMIDAGRLMYCDSVGAILVVIPSEEYLREKGIIK